VTHESGWIMTEYLEKPYKHPQLVHDALGYAALGLRVIPLGPGRKVPWMERWSERATCDPAQIVHWFEAWPTSNIGIATGRGLIALDVDPRNGGGASFKGLLDRRTLPITARALTGSGGDHYLFEVDAGLKIPSFGDLLPGIDIKGESGQFVAEPSVHPKTGREYVWLIRPQQVIARAPDWLIERIRDRGRAEPPPEEVILPLNLNRPGDEVRLIEQMVGKFPVTATGQRNQKMALVVASLLGRGYEADLALRVYMGWYDHYRAQGLIRTGRAEAEREAARCIRRTIQGGKIRPARSATDHRGSIAGIDLGGGREALRRARIENGVLVPHPSCQPLEPEIPPHPCNRVTRNRDGSRKLCETGPEFAFVESLLAYFTYKVQRLGEHPPKATREQVTQAIQDRHQISLDRREFGRMKDKFIRYNDKHPTRFELAVQISTGRPGVASEFELTYPSYQLRVSAPGKQH
jgi:hypothetical protein